MAEITSSLIKEMAIDLGADIVGIASADRFEGAPPGHGPLDLMSDSKSIIVMGIRIPDPVVEYETYHLKMEDIPQETAVGSMIESFYMQMGHYALDLMLNTMAVKIANKVEINWGLRALPTPNTINTGLGRSGRGPLIGPRVRFVSVITEAGLEPDPLITEKICFRGTCGGKDGPKCFQRCADGALQLRDGLDRDAIFIDIPSRTEISKCIKFDSSGSGFSCGFVGTCMRECPTGKKVTGNKG